MQACVVEFAESRVMRKSIKSVMKRRFGFVVLVLLLGGAGGRTAPNAFPVDERLTQRTWTDITGKFEKDATLVELEGDKVTLRLDNGRVTELPASRLSPEDQDYLEAWRILQASDLQSEAVPPLVQSPNPASTIGVLEAKQLEERGVVAGHALSGLLATGGIKNTEKASRILDETIKRLRLLKNHFPGQYSVTLAAALNNRAILALRERKASRSAALLVEAGELTASVPFYVNHNAKILVAVASGKNLLGISTVARKKLTNLASNSDIAGTPSFEVPARYMYSTACEVRLSLASTNDDTIVSKLRGADLYPELICMTCVGSGRIDCAKCERGVVSKKEPFVAARGIRGDPIIRLKTVAVACPNCKGAASFDCPDCDGGSIPLGR